LTAAEEQPAGRRRHSACEGEAESARGGLLSAFRWPTGPIGHLRTDRHQTAGVWAADMLSTVYKDSVNHSLQVYVRTIVCVHTFKIRVCPYTLKQV